MINGTFCGRDEDLELVKHLRGIVLIINTNSERQAATAGRFMRALYSRFFEDVVVIGPKSIPELGVEGATAAPAPRLSLPSPCASVRIRHQELSCPGSARPYLCRPGAAL